MMPVIGVDGCHSGWFAVRLELYGSATFEVFSRVEELWDKWGDASLILIDIPIGLSDERRQCDIDARNVLRSPRASSVFTPPCRAALEPCTYEEASAKNFEVTGQRLSKQAWGILPKIKEVDEFICHNAEARSRIREVHPEVCFWAFKGETPMAHRKGTTEGFWDRLKLLRSLDAMTETNVDKAWREVRDRKVAMDDILDALVAALTADCHPDELRSFPSVPQFDACGLRMEMVYRH